MSTGYARPQTSGSSLSSQQEASVDQFPPRATTTLHVVTMPPSSEPECDHTYTCPCEGCCTDRANAIARGIRPRRNPVPFKRAA